MKIAVCVSGGLRQYKFCIPYLNKYIIEDLQNKGHEVDVFIHVWKFKTKPINLIHNLKWLEDTEIFDDNEIINLYKPKKYVIETFTDERMEEIIKEQNGHFVIENAIKFANMDSNDRKKGIDVRRQVNMYGMYYKIYACNELKKEYEKENGFTYDVVMRTRPDLIYQKPFDFYNNTFFEELINKKLLVYMTCRSGICDHFFIGKSDVMDQMTQLFLKLTDIFKKRKSITSENVLKMHTNGMATKEYNKCGKNRRTIHHIIERIFQKAYKDLPRL